MLFLHNPYLIFTTFNKRTTYLNLIRPEVANIQHDFELILGIADLGLARRVDVALGAGTQQVSAVQSRLQQVRIHQPHAEMLVHQAGRVVPGIPPVSGKQRKQRHGETRTCENQEQNRTLESSRLRFEVVNNSATKSWKQRCQNKRTLRIQICRSAVVRLFIY